MAKLVSHKVEVTSIDGSQRHKAYHLMQCNAAVHKICLISTLEMPIHICIYQPKDDGLIPNKRLVVALTIAYCFLISAPVLDFPEDAAWLPVFVFFLFYRANPIIRDVHCKTIVETIASILKFRSQSGHTAYLLGYRYCFRIYLMNQLIS